MSLIQQQTTSRNTPARSLGRMCFRVRRRLYADYIVYFLRLWSSRRPAVRRHKAIIGGSDDWRSIRALRRAIKAAFAGSQFRNFGMASPGLRKGESDFSIYERAVACSAYRYAGSTPNLEAIARISEANCCGIFRCFPLACRRLARLREGEVRCYRHGAASKCVLDNASYS